MTLIGDVAVSTYMLMALHAPLVFRGTKAYQKKRLSVPLR